MKKIYTLTKLMLLTVILMVGSANMFGQYTGIGVFNKISSLDELTDGYYVVAYGTTKAMHNTSSGTSFIFSTNLSVVGDIITNPGIDIVWKIETDGNVKTIYNEAVSKYVSYSGSGNSAQLVDAVTTNGQRWSFAYTSNLFRVQNIGTSGRYLQYNSNDPRFACYTGTQNHLTLYKMEEQVTDPTISVSNVDNNAILFENVEIGASNVTKTFNVSGMNLTSDINLAISGTDAASFEVSPASIPFGTGSVTNEVVTVTYKPSATDLGTVGAELTLSSTGATDIVIDLMGETVLATPVATEGTAVGVDGFTANWNIVPGAESYLLDVYQKNVYLDESFDDVDGTGGNDDRWGGTGTATVAYRGTDGWVLENGYKGYQCVKLGTSSARGIITTPELGLNGDAVVEFRAGAWDNNSEQTDLMISIAGGGALSEASVVMEKGAFNNYSVNITGGTATSKITFSGKDDSNSRFFIDDILVGQITPIAGSPFTSTTNSYTLTGLEGNTDYYYTVTAINGTSRSAQSNEIRVTTENPNSILNENVNISVYSNGDGIVVETNVVKDVVVYTLFGEKVYTQNAVNGQIEMPVVKGQLYLVKVGDKVYKVIM